MLSHKHAIRIIKSSPRLDQLVLFFSLFLCVNVNAQQPPASTESATTPSITLHNDDYRAAFDSFDTAYDKWRRTTEQDNTRGGLAWRESYLMLAYMQMYRATNDRQYLRKLTNRFDAILSMRDDKLGRLDSYTSTALVGWGCKGYDKTVPWHVFIVHTGIITLAPAEFVNIVRTDSKLQPEFATSATLYRDEIRKSISDADQYWREPAPKEGWYVDPKLGLLPLNQSNALGCVLLEMHSATGDPAYLNKAERLARFFKNRLREKDSFYTWAYWPKEDGNGEGNEDISHAAINIDFAVRCAHKGIVFTPHDIEKFAATWLQNVARPDNTWAGDVGGQRVATPYLPGSPGRWLVLCELLTPELCHKLHQNAAKAYQKLPVQMPSHALGLANLLRYKKAPLRH